jgi:hypothetical protein
MNYLYNFLRMIRCTLSTIAHFTSGFLQVLFLIPHAASGRDGLFNYFFTCPSAQVAVNADCFVYRDIRRTEEKASAIADSVYVFRGITCKNLENTSITERT